MNAFTDFLDRVLRGVLKLALFLAAGVFVLSFLLAAAVVVLGVSLWSLLTGRKPAPVVMFSRFKESSQRYSQRYAGGAWPGRAPGPSGDVVDVQATEVNERPATGTPAPASPDGATRFLR